MKTTLFFLLDAFRWDYLTKEDAPFLWELAQEGIYAKKLKTASGFTQRTVVATGTYADKTNSFTMYTYDSENSPYRFTKPIAGLLRILEKNKVTDQLARSILFRISKLYSRYASPAKIPLSLLRYIGVSEDEKSAYEKDAYAVESLFDKLQEKNLNYKMIMFPEINCDDATVVKTLLEEKKLYNGFFIQFSDSDAQCHIHGSESKKRREIVKEIDNRLKHIDKKLRKKYEDINYVIIGDHGMMDCPELINIEEATNKFAKKHKLVSGKDYLLFLDSTMARYWVFNNKAKSLFKKFFRTKIFTNGTFLDKKTQQQMRVPVNSTAYGEHIWRIDPGKLIFPDYFHREGEIMKAMHGYDSNHEKMKGFAVIHGKGIHKKKISEVHLTDICPTLCDVYGVTYPKSNEGMSLLKQ